MVNALIAGFSLLVAIVTPFVAYPLAQVVRKGRQAIDNMLNWKGKDAQLFEELEDGLTYLASLSVAVLVWLLVGVIYTWYVQSFSLRYNPWLGYATTGFPTVGTNELNYYSAAIILYWSVVYLVTFITGWLRAKAGR